MPYKISTSNDLTKFLTQSGKNSLIIHTNEPETIKCDLLNMNETKQLYLFHNSTYNYDFLVKHDLTFFWLDKKYVVNAIEVNTNGGSRSYEKMTVKELQTRCRKRKIAYSGLRKAALIAVLRSQK